MARHQVDCDMAFTKRQDADALFAELDEYRVKGLRMAGDTLSIGYDIEGALRVQALLRVDSPVDADKLEQTVGAYKAKARTDVRGSTGRHECEHPGGSCKQGKSESWGDTNA